MKPLEYNQKKDGGGRNWTVIPVSSVAWKFSSI